MSSQNNSTIDHNHNFKQASQREPIAIIGIGCRFPGGVNSPESFWQLLCNEVDAIGEIPSDRIDLDTYFDPQPATPGKMMTRWGGFLEQIDQFDNYFFGMSPREADRLDPQQRLLLEVAWEGLEDAGLPADKLKGSNTGVFVGMWLNDYEARMFANPDLADFYMTTGSGRYSASGRISYNFGFQGPSMTIDTACSSSLVAVRLACQSLWNDECSLALAGGANVILQPHISIAYSQSRMMAPDGHCKFGDAEADGYVRSEGAGLVLLKKLSQALADGDPVYAVIQGGAVNNDGQSSGFLATPGQAGQKEMLQRAYQDAGIAPSQVQYVEAHGTGTRAGDPVELGALGAVLSIDRPDSDPCFVGSVKTNFGHTEGAAGVAGLIKVALILKHRAIPASLHLQQLNPNIPWQSLKLQIPTQLISLPAEVPLVVAGVSSFGIAGTNAHIVLQEPPPQARPKEAEITPIVDKARLFALSARTNEALKEMAGAYGSWLEAQPDQDAWFNDFMYSAMVKRSHHEQRLGLVVHNRKELIDALYSFSQGDNASGVSTEPKDIDKPPKVVFIFPGQGSQWYGMGRQLLQTEAVFRQTLAQCEAAMQPFVDWSLTEQLSLDENAAAYRLNEIDVIQPTLLSIEIALAALWQSWGIQPDAVIGHSMGEVAAAYIAGALSLADAMQVICRRSQLLRRTSGQGAMAFVELTIEEAEAALAGYEERVSVAVSNSPRSTVLSGDTATLETIVEQLKSQDVFCRFIKVDVASHSSQMDPLKADLLAALQGLQPQPAAVPIYSTALGQVISGENSDAAYWIQNLRQPVLFSKMSQQLMADGHNIFIEMSPHPILLPAVQQVAQFVDTPAVTISSLRREEAEQATILGALATLYAQGCALKWEQLYPDGQFVKLPAYVWQRERFWYEPPQSSRSRALTSGSHPLLGYHTLAATGVHLWEGELSLERLPYLRDHQVRGMAMLPAAAYIELTLAAVREAFEPGLHTLGKITLNEALSLAEDAVRETQFILTPDMPGTASGQFFSRPVGEPAATDWTLHFSVTVQLAHSETFARERSADHRPLPAAATMTPGLNHYQAMQARGLGYGPVFQGIAELGADDQPNQATARLQFSEEVVTASGYQLHPAVLDACFQLVIATLNDQGKHSSDTYLPIGLDSLQLYHRPDAAANLWAYAVRQGDGAGFSGDVFLLDEAGQVLVAARGLYFQRLAQHDQSALDDWLYELQWQPQPAPAALAGKPNEAGQWLILADEGGLGQALTDQLEDLGERCLLLWRGKDAGQLKAGHYRLDPAQPQVLEQLLPEIVDRDIPWRGIVHLWSVDDDTAAETSLATLKSAQEKGCLNTLALIQAIDTLKLSAAPRLWLVTRNAQAVGQQDNSLAIGQAPLWGLGRVIAHEHPELRCCRIDLGAESDAGALFRALWTEDQEDEIALRGNERYVSRLIPFQAQAAKLEAADRPLTPAGAQPFRVETIAPGLFDNLLPHAVERQQPGPGQVEIKVHATGLNFMNVMSALGIYPGYADGVGPLGIECAGEISALGEGVSDYVLGDAVVAIAYDSLASHALADARLVAHKPPQLSFDEAATIPIVFLTAYYALHDLGRMEANERVLIHSATGGVGLAAIQLAQRAGAEIFASAGSPEKRDYLRTLGIAHIFNSRSLSFADEIMQVTGGEGVDLVLNSLAGEAIARGLSCLRAYGRFLEIGKRDIYQNSQVGLLPFQNSLSYFAIDLDRMSRERPALLGAILRKIMQWMAAGELKPLPLRTFPVSQSGEAFRYMAQAKHIGKIVISLQDPEVKLAAPDGSKLPVRADKAYVITGGLGGLGLTVAQWLVEQGARHLALLGRSLPSATAQASIKQLQAMGAQVRTVQADVSQPESLAAGLAQIKQEMPAIAGVIHAAGLLADSSLLQMDRERFERVTAPKIEGSWNLHALTQDSPLDFFICFSSVTALLGTPGQANYAAANAFLDALVHYRRALGQPALSLNWGPWSEVGLAAAQDNRGERLSQRGLGSLTPAQGLAALTRLFRPDISQAAIMPFEVQKWVDFYPVAGTSLLLSQLHTPQAEAAAESASGTIREALLNIDPGRRRQNLLETHVCEQVAQVLQLSPSRVDINKPLKNLGMDSLMTLELRNRLERSLGVTLSATLIWNYPTVSALVPFVAGKMQIPLEVASAPAEGSVRPPAEDAAASLESLTDESDLSQTSAEVDALSRQEVEDLLAEELAAIDDLLN